MKTIILISLALCLFVTISAEKSSHKHAEKLLKSGHELKTSKLDNSAVDTSKSSLPLNEEVPAVKPTANRKHHRHGKNKKGAGGAPHHQQQKQEEKQHQQQNGRSRKSHAKPKANNNGPTKGHSKHGRKQGRGKQAQ